MTAIRAIHGWVEGRRQLYESSYPVLRHYASSRKHRLRDRTATTSTNCNFFCRFAIAKNGAYNIL